MKIKNLLSITCAVSFVALSLVGCSDYDNGFTEKQIQFIQSFKEIYGDIDETQDWNLAKRASVTVTTSETSNVKIYAQRGGIFTLVGDYADVSGTRTLGFDVVEGTTDIMVSNGFRSVFTHVGESVNLGNTRAVVASTDKDYVTVTESEDIRHLSYKYIEAIVENDPSTPENAGILPEGNNNSDHVTQDFMFVYQGPFSIYPIYWNTSSYHILGIYWYADGEFHCQDIYKTRNGTDLEACSDPNAAQPHEHINRNNSLYSPVVEVGETPVSQAITISFPEADEGIVFGFYLDVYYNSANAEGAYDWTKGDDYNYADTYYYHTVYSNAIRNTMYAEKSMNGKTSQGGWSGQNSDGGDFFGATFELEIDGRLRKFFCFEDWNTQDLDLNDIIFMFGENNTPVTLNEDANSWIISAEDLGDTYDIDYNDVVLEVQYVSGKETATVTPLAAGGTLASYISFGDNNLGEIHELFGVGEQASGSYSPINVTNSVVRTTGTSKTIKVDDPDNFTLSSVLDITQSDNTDADLEYIANNNMGGFKMIVYQQDGVSNGGKQTIQNSVTSGSHNVPYVICTPKFMDNGKHYRWPKENVPMFATDKYSYDGKEAYNNKDGNTTFKQWVEDKSNFDWYNYPNLEETCAPNVTNGNVGGSTGGNTTDNGTLIAPGVTTEYIKIDIVKNDDGTYNLTCGEHTLIGVSSVTFTCVANTINAWYMDQNEWYVICGNIEGYISASKTFDSEELSLFVQNGGMQIANDPNTPKDDFDLYWK